MQNTAINLHFTTFTDLKYFAILTLCLGREIKRQNNQPKTHFFNYKLKGNIMKNIYTKKQNEKFDAFLAEMNELNKYQYWKDKAVKPNKISVDVYWTHDKKGNSILSEEYMLHLFRRELEDYKKTYEKNN